MVEVIEFKKEFYLQTVTNEHLKDLFDIELIAAEFQFEKCRFDGFAYDKKTKSFVIIEYKNKKDSNVLNQAKFYCDLLQNNPQEYIDKYNIEFKTSLKEDDFEIEKTRVIIISPEFKKDQIDKIKDSRCPFKLYTATLYKCDEENGCISYHQVNGDFNKKLKIKLDDLKITEEMLLEDKSPEMIDLYYNLKNSILNEFDDVEIRYLVDQFSFRVNDKLICLVRFLKSSFNIYIYGKNLRNADNTIDISEKSTGGIARYNLKYESDEDFDYFRDLFEQTYNQKKV